jgi:RNA polymerase sigma factor (sigma-70 family)
MPKTITITDEQIMAAFKVDTSKTQAFEWLLDAYQRKVYWHVRRIVINHDDADDVVQNTFIKVWENISSFRGESKLYTWIFRIATNESLNFLNKNKPVQSMEDTSPELVNHLVSSSYFNGDAAALKLQQAILLLPEKQRIVFNMKYFDNMKYEDMSEILDTSVGALKASYHHAVKKIEDFIQKL